MLKKIICMTLCCLMLTACGEKGIKLEANEQRPKYCGESTALDFPESIKYESVPDGFITRKMASDMKKVIKAHKSINDSEDGSIDEDTAVDISIAIIKNRDPSYFQKPTSYWISYIADVDAYFISISQDPESINIINDSRITHVISKKDGAFLGFWYT